MEIAVLGGGNGSIAAAVDLTEQGHSVRLWRRDPDVVAAMGPITVRDHAGVRTVAPARITADLAEAVRGAALIVCPAPATAQADIAARLAPLLVDGQVVFLPPGTFGTYVMARAQAEAGNAAETAFAEAGTLPYLTRKHGADTIAITTRASRLPTGIFPRVRSAHALGVIRAAYPSVEDAGDGLSGALMNAGPVIHPPLILMNAGPIEHFEHWDIHNEGTQPSIRRVTDALDGERMATREALGYGAPHFPLIEHYTTDQWMYGNLAHDKLTESGDWRERLILTEHRYMREDVAMGLAFLVSVAEWAGVPCPVARGLLALGGTICGEDFLRTGRTLRSLGLSGLSRTEMETMLTAGLSSRQT